MTNKAEHLAKDLIALRLKYSAEDFDASLDLIGEGPIFGSLIDLVRATDGKIAKAPTRSKLPRRPRLPASSIGIGELQYLVSGDARMEEFLRRFTAREILVRGASSRAFAEALGMNLAKKPPSRLNLAKLFVDALLRLPAQRREELVTQAEEAENRSSLAMWSNVILRGNPGNR